MSEYHKWRMRQRVVKVERLSMVSDDSTSRVITLSMVSVDSTTRVIMLSMVSDDLTSENVGG